MMYEQNKSTTVQIVRWHLEEVKQKKQVVTF